MKARDVSNFTIELTADIATQWRADDVGLVLIQAFPESYQQYAEQQRQVEWAVQNGFPFDHYIYDYLGDPTWLSAALDGIDAQGNRPRMVWLDEEDVETEEGWTPAQRDAAIDESVNTVIYRDLEVGIYTGAWWWNPRVGSNSCSELKLWTAQYDGIADATVFTSFGGWTSCAIKQYAGSQPDGTDLDVLSTEEAEAVTGNCDTYKAAIERAVNRIQIELDRKTAAGKAAPLRRDIFTEIGSELFQALQAT